jgi:hypothetical protein
MSNFNPNKRFPEHNFPECIALVKNFLTSFHTILLGKIVLSIIFHVCSEDGLMVKKPVLPKQKSLPRPKNLFNKECKRMLNVGF